MAFVYSMSDEDYHNRGELSSTGARKLLPPSCPAIFKYWRDNPEPYNSVFEFGKAAHQMVLGVGPTIVKLPYKDWRTKQAQEQQKEIRAAGNVALLEKEFVHLAHMVKRIEEHPVAPHLFSNGAAEQTIIWIDEEFDIGCRARLDWLPHVKRADERLIISDYKTSTSADPQKIRKAIAEYGYHQQLAWYIDAAKQAQRTSQEVVALLVVQEKTPPYLVSVVQIPPEALKLGAKKNHRAKRIYRQCLDTDLWPGYGPPDVIEKIDLPPWAYLDED